MIKDKRDKIKIVTFTLMIFEVTLCLVLFPETMLKTFDVEITIASLLLIGIALYQWFFISEIIAEILLSLFRRFRK